MTQQTLACEQCGHPVSDHDTYGCTRWLTAQNGNRMCDCKLTRRSLIGAGGQR